MKVSRLFVRVKVWIIPGLLFGFLQAVAQESVHLALSKPDAIIDLRTIEGAALTQTQWRFSEASLAKTSFRTPGPSGNDTHLIYPTGKPNETFTISPQASGADFDDSKWTVLRPDELDKRVGQGLFSMVWYRFSITIPQTVGVLPTGELSAVLELVVDDYSEIVVDGKIATHPGMSGSGTVAGWNTRNRVLLGRVRPGQRFQIAVLAMNAPLARLPENYIWIRSASLSFYKNFASPIESRPLDLVKFHRDVDAIVSSDEKLHKVATGFQFTEGPVWHPSGFLLFSDPNTNVIYAYRPDTGNVEVFMTNSGYAGIDIGVYRQPGSNGLAIDAEGRLIICQHGNRRVIRLEPKGPVTVISDGLEGKRLNSPNDVALRSDGTIFFTDPPYGLPAVFDDKKKELSFSGVYAVRNGITRLLYKGLKGPNGIVLSPDEKFLYVSNWDITDIHRTKVIKRFDLAADGSISNERDFFQMNQSDGEDALDGLEVDDKGNIYCAGPDGIWIISPEGVYLGRIKTPEHAANLAWGEDGHTLFIAASSSVYKLRMISGRKLK